MSRQKGSPKTGGRQKGTPNKFTMSVKEGLEHAWQGIGGAAHLTAWARENPTEFYKLLAKLLPKSLDVTIKDEISTILEAARRRAADVNDSTRH